MVETQIEADLREFNWRTRSVTPARIFIFMMKAGDLFAWLLCVLKQKQQFKTIKFLTKQEVFSLLLLINSYAMKLTLFTSCILFFLTTLPEKSSKGFFYCIDHPGKTVYYSTGDVVVKKGLEETEYYQYGFMKWNGWINKSWQGLEYDLRIFSTAGFKDAVKSASDSLVAVHLRKGYQVRIVPMPYPMKPFSNYKKDGNN